MSARRAGLAPAGLAPAGLALRLALGEAPADDGAVRVADPAAWERLLHVAIGERLAPLAWQRAGGWLRACAPADVAGRWRAVAVTEVLRSAAQLATLGEVLDVLGAAGVAPAVLKGAPLAQRLHGDAALRPSADIDLFVTAEERERADAALRAQGWTRRDDSGSWDAEYERGGDGECILLELHSSLVPHELSHLPVPKPVVRAVSLGGRTVPAHDDALLPAYLAAHMAKHRRPALLWYVDLAVLWSRLDEDARAAARAAARRAGLGRYLEWGLRRAAAVDRAARGDEAALALLGVDGQVRRGAHPIFRDVLLAPSPVAACRAVSGWAWPRPLRSDPAALARRWTTRLTRLPEYVRGPAQRGAGSAPSTPSAALHDLRAALAAGREQWVQGVGSSMWPTISPGARVLVAPLARRGARRGEVVLVDARGHAMLHRVATVSATGVQTAGDANLRPDIPVTADAVLGRALAAVEGGRTVALTRTMRFGLLPLARYYRARTRLVLARAWRRARPAVAS